MREQGKGDADADGDSDSDHDRGHDHGCGHNNNSEGEQQHPSSGQQHPGRSAPSGSPTWAPQASSVGTSNDSQP